MRNYSNKNPQINVHPRFDKKRQRVSLQLLHAQKSSVMCHSHYCLLLLIPRRAPSNRKRWAISSRRITQTHADSDL